MRWKSSLSRNSRVILEKNIQIAATRSLVSRKSARNDEVSGKIPVYLKILGVCAVGCQKMGPCVADSVAKGLLMRSHRSKQLSRSGRILRLARMYHLTPLSINDEVRFSIPWSVSICKFIALYFRFDIWRVHYNVVPARLDSIPWLACYTLSASTDSREDDIAGTTTLMKRTWATWHRNIVSR